MFLGYSFASGLYSLDATPIPNVEATKIEALNGVCGEIYTTSKVSNYSAVIPTNWDFDTILHANFKNNLLAGNIDFAVSEVNKLKLKRRKKGTTDWMTLYEQPVLTAEDLIIRWTDKTPRSAVPYEYTIVPMFDQVEGSFFTSEITPDFRGLFIIDRDKIFATELDVQITEQRNKPRSVITTLNRKYPYVISNGVNNFDSGSVTAQFLEYDPTVDDWNVGGSHNFVHNLKDFLNNGSAKILKYEDGRMWLIEVSSTGITDAEDEMHLQVHTSIGMRRAIEVLKGEDVFGFVELKNVWRSRLAELVERM